MKIQMILDSKHIKYTVMDITEPGLEDEKDFMRSNSTSKGGTVSDPGNISEWFASGNLITYLKNILDPRHALPPQIFNDQDYCGDYDAFDLANEIDNLEVFLKLSPEEIPEIKKSTIDTSKLEPNSNGKVVEDPVDDVKEEIGADQDEDKENKTEEAANEVWRSVLLEIN